MHMCMHLFEAYVRVQTTNTDGIEYIVDNIETINREIMASDFLIE